MDHPSKKYSYHGRFLFAPPAKSDAFCWDITEYTPISMPMSMMPGKAHGKLENSAAIAPITPKTHDMKRTKCHFLSNNNPIIRITAVTPKGTTHVSIVTGFANAVMP